MSTEDGKWFFENARQGRPVIVTNTARRNPQCGSDGLGDWNRVLSSDALKSPAQYDQSRSLLFGFCVIGTVCPMFRNSVGQG